ncbi:hypothetical protein K450DRAFT_236249 [Umbelopsis ramanniana AG]|uniref:Uncharacterized protein n=1 Tax=Umbelopsis ramanniana AG TaxID=1314678 RepID=A0AAD5EAX3_UMBRA|nr:uncharacterized protein K450DRAFT_236249 [Umbelopsis ramanniana AG]KAI8580566.1 hypothetical protein K450DRAFT_236249 [Umbelopsis ramanniana AG]
MVEENTLQQIWRLTNELAQQQSANKEAINGITQQMSDVKQRSSALLTSGVFNHNGELYNYNDSQQRNAEPASASQNSPETLEESDETSAKQDELKRQLRTMTNKNQQLEAECAQLKRLLKDYESGMESATSSMRLQVNSHNDAVLRLQREYDSLLSAERQTTSALVWENKMLQLNISKIARMLRELYSLGTESEQDTVIQQLVVENQGLRDMLNKDMNVFNLGIENDTVREKSSDTLVGPK